MKSKVIKGLLIGLIVAGIGVTGVCLVHAKHTAEAKQEEILLCKEETKWYYRTENGVLQKRQWSLTYGRWMSEWTEVAGTEIPGNEIIERPSDETDKIPEKKEGLLAKSDNEIRNAAYASLGLNPAEWFGKYLKKTSEEAVLLLYPPKAQITQTDCYADIVLGTMNYICLVSVRQDGEELSFTSVKEYGVSQVGIYETGKDTYFGIVYSDTSDFYGIEAYGMTWYRLDEVGNCQRICTAAETSGLYDYWKDKKPVLSTDGTITLYNGNGEATTVSATVFLSGTVPYNAEYGVSGPELIRKVIQEDEKREDLYFRVGYEGAEVTHYILNENRIYFIIQEYSSSHAAGFRSMAIGTMDLSGNILYCDVFSADRSKAVYLQTDAENHGQYGADYLVLSTETEYQGLVSSAKQVFRTDETGFVQTWITRENGQEYVIDYDAERIPIDETYFSGELFREYIKQEIDTNGDGVLTKQEREQVKEIDFDSGHYRWVLKGQYTEKKAVLDELNWFPNLERLELMSQAEVYLYQHPGIVSINWNESGSCFVYADDCEKLEVIAIHMSSGGAVYAKNCKELKWILDFDGNLNAVYTSETPNCSIRDNETLFPPEMPESRVKIEAYPEAVLVPVDEKYFSGEFFREYIRANIDTDGDGLLGKEEREQVKRIHFEYWRDDVIPEGNLVIDGLNWFPNLTHIGHMGGGNFEIILDHHPGVTSIGGSEVWGYANYFIDGCEKLEHIEFSTNGDLTLYVNDCKNLKSISGEEFSFSGLYVSECPKARFYMNDTIGFPEDWYVDDDVRLVWAERGNGSNAALDGKGIWFTEEGQPYWEHGFHTDKEQEIHWLGTVDDELIFSEQVNQILTMQNSAVPKELLDAGKVDTNLKMIVYSPKNSALYFAISKEKDSALYWESLAKRYYVAEVDGTITAYNSMEEMVAAAKGIEGLQDIEEISARE